MAERNELQTTLEQEKDDDITHQETTGHNLETVNQQEAECAATVICHPWYDIHVKH